MQDPLHCLSPQDGAEGGPKGPRSPHSSGQQASEPRSVCVPTLPQRPTGTKSRASISLPKSAPQIQSCFLGKEHRDQVAKEARTARLCGKGWPAAVTRVAWGYTHTHPGTFLRFPGQVQQAKGSGEGDFQGGQAGRGLSQLCTASLPPTPPAVGGGRREQGSWGGGPHAASIAARLRGSGRSRGGNREGGSSPGPAWTLHLTSPSPTSQAAACRARRDPHTAGRPQPRPSAVLPGSRPTPALTSSMSRSRMLGGCGAPVTPSPAALSTRSSRHLVAAATAAMATTPSATEPRGCGNGPAKRATLPAGRWGGATPAE